MNSLENAEKLMPIFAEHAIGLGLSGFYMVRVAKYFIKYSQNNDYVAKNFNVE